MSNERLVALAGVFRVNAERFRLVFDVDDEFVALLVSAVETEDADDAECEADQRIPVHAHPHADGDQQEHGDEVQQCERSVVGRRDGVPRPRPPDHALGARPNEVGVIKEPADALPDGDRVAAEQVGDDVDPLELLLDGAALRLELGVHRNVEPFAFAFPGGGLDGGDDLLFDHAGDDRRFDDDEMVVVLGSERLAELFGGREHDRQVDAAVLAGGRLDREEGQVRVEDGVVVSRRAESVADVFRVEFIEPGLSDGRVAGVEPLDDRLIDVDGGHVVAEVRKAGGEGGADVAAAENARVHSFH